MKYSLSLLAAAAMFATFSIVDADAAPSRYDTASERYIERVIDKYVTAYGDAISGDAKGRKRVELMNRVYPYQIMDKARVAAAAKWGVLLTER